MALTTSLSAKDVGMVYLEPGKQLTDMIGVIPYVIADIGEYFAPIVAKIAKSGPVKFVVGDGFTKDEEKQIRRQFTQIFKGTRADLPGDGATHDEVVARLEDQSRALEREGKNVADGESFFDALVTLHRAEDKDAAVEL